jgi:PPOX class probable F420-dependent enzyme
VSLAMSVVEREAFLAGLHVGVLSVAGENGQGPLAVPIWYLYEPGGEVRIITGGRSRKVRLIGRAERCSLCVQNEQPPYQYVTVEGPATIGAAPDPDENRAMAVRYLGEGAEAWLAANADGAAGSVVVRLRPERWLSEDFGKAYR